MNLMMKKLIRCASLVASAVLGVGSLSAKTVAWYHFNEGANGTKPTASGTKVFENAADPGSLMGKAYAINANSMATNTNAGYRPAYTNDTPDCETWRWHDPATGTRGEDPRCLYVKTSDSNGAGQAGVVFVDDDVKLHCQQLTAEFMVKSQPGVTLKNWAHVLVMRNASSANVKAWGLMINPNGQVSVQIETRNEAGSGVDTTKSISSGFASQLASSPSVTDGRWHHIALTYDGSTAKLYIDYVQRASKSWTNPIDYNENCEGRLCICGLDVATYGRWQGFIDEVRISDEALSPSKFIHPGALPEKGSKVTDQDTIIYLPLDSAVICDNPFFGTVGAPLVFNETVASNTLPIGISLSTDGILPTTETSGIATNTIHSGIFATNSAVNGGCWKFGENTTAAGKSVHLTLDDYSMNNNTHLISSGSFTIEFWLNALSSRVGKSCYLVAEMSKSAASNPKGQPGTLLIYLTADGALKCRLVSDSALADYQDGADLEYNDATVTGICDGQWHHVALSVDRTRQTAAFYVDHRLVTLHEDFVLASMVANTATYKPLEISGGWGPDRGDEFHNLSIDELRITRRALAPQEFLTGGPNGTAAVEPTRAWIDFDGDLNVKPRPDDIPAGISTASTVSMVYSQDVPGVRRGKVLDGNGTVLRESNTSSMYFSGAFGSGEASPDTSTQRLFFDRNILLERDMKAMTVEFFMKGTANAAKAWACFVRMYGNATGSDNRPFRRLWSIGYSDTDGHIYVIMDYNDAAQTTYYPDNAVSLADGRWHHIAITFEPNGSGNTLCKIYKDYEQLGTTKTFTGELQVGDFSASSLAMGSRYNGYIDEVRVSKGVLSVDQMLHVNQGGLVIVVR